MPRIALACLDMAGTTVSDDGVVEKAFTAAAEAAGLTDDPARYAEAMQIVRDTMGQSKIEVFRQILGDEGAAQSANAAFERAYAGLLADGAVSALPGAAATLKRLQDAGLHVCLTTGFSPQTRDALLELLGWTSLVGLAVSPSDAGRGRPWPDMIQLAARTFGVDDPAAVAVVGDTPSDIRTGLAAGASIVAGVLTGAGTHAELRAAGATHVLDTIAELPDLLVPVSVLFLVLDGLPARHVGPRHTPALAGLARDGGWAPAGGCAVLPTSTYPNHATFVTGTGPRAHGIHGNHVVDHTGVREAAAVGAAGTTLFDDCRAAGASSAAVLGDHHLVGVMHADRADTHWPRDGVLPPDIPLDDLGHAADAEVLTQLRPVLAAAPDLVVAHLNQPDTVAHRHGPDSDAAFAQYRATDAVLAEILDALAPRWSRWAVVVVSDHDQETVTDAPPVDLHAAARAAGAEVTVVDEGGSALVHGDVDLDDAHWLDEVDGVAGHRPFSDRLRHVWAEPGRWFGERPLALRGVHGSPRQQAQVAVCGGGHPGVPALAAALGRRRPAAAEWRDAVLALLGVDRLA